MKIGDYVDEVIFWFDWWWLHKIPLPSWPKYIRDENEEIYKGNRYSMSQWYGDFGCFYFRFVLNFFLQLSNLYLPHDWEKWNKAKREAEGEQDASIQGEGRDPQ